MFKKHIKKIFLALTIMMMVVVSIGMTSNVMAATDPSHGTLQIEYVDIGNREIVDTRSIDGPVGTEWDEIPQVEPWTFTDDDYKYTGETPGRYEVGTKELTVYVEMGFAYISFVDFMYKDLIKSVVFKGKVGTDWNYDIPEISGYKYIETDDSTDGKLVGINDYADVYFIYQKVLDPVTIEVEETKIIEIANPCFISDADDDSNVNESDTNFYLTGEWRVKDTSLLTIKNQELSTDLKTYKITLLGEAIGETSLEIWIERMMRQMDAEFVCAEIPVTIIAKEIPEPEVKEGSVKVTYEDVNGKEIAPAVAFNGEVGSTWTTNKLEIKNYKFDKVVGNVTGKFIDGEVLVKYIYKKIEAPVIVEPVVDKDVKDDSGVKGGLTDDKKHVIPNTAIDGSLAIYTSTLLTSVSGLCVLLRKKRK